MSDSAAVWSFWLSIFGATTGGFGLLIAGAAASYTKRQAIAAEGPQAPEIEILSETWGADNWYSLEIITRNRTGKSWKLISAAVKSPRRAKIIAGHYLSYVDGSGLYQSKMPTSDEVSRYTAVTLPGTTVGPQGSRNSAGYRDICREEFFVQIPDQSRFKLFRKHLTIIFVFEDKAAIARQRRITLKRNIAPKA